MQLLVSKYVKTESLDKDDLEVTGHKVVLKGSREDVKVQLVVDSTDVEQLKQMVPIERGMSFELDV